MNNPTYLTTIGIECHVQLKTKTKLFAAVGNDSRGAAPNTLISHICLGMPGALPVLNGEAVRLASKAAFALGTEPQKYSYFERKHYFYPDSPMGYQISQLKKPIIVGGSVTIEVDGKPKKIRINRAQLEADAGKNTHPAGKDYSLVDLNRAGTPLLEIVSEPDMHSAAEARAYVRELYLLMRYADVSDCDLYYGNMRFDVNVSVSNDPDTLGTRTETKNLNSFRAVEKVVEYESKRQAELLKQGQEIVQETRGWDEAKQKTISQRTKEESHDYRYMPEPDVPPIVLDDVYIDKIRNEIPLLPGEWRKKLQDIGLDESQVDILLEAEVADDEIDYLVFIEEVMGDKIKAKQLANWMVNIEIPLISEQGKRNIPQGSKWALLYEPVYQLVKEDKLSSTNAKQLISDLLVMEKLPSNVADYAEKKGLIQVSDTGELDSIVDMVLSENPDATNDVKAGEMKAIGFLVGQVMKASEGKANPGMVQKLIREKLGG